MPKLLFFMLTTLNGFYERGPWGLDWHNVDAEFEEFAVQQLDAAGTLLFGRKTYEGMASYWPTPQAIAADPGTARRMNAMPKIVFSRTLKSADWSNTRLIAGDAGDEVAGLRRLPGKDLLLLGSSDLATSLAPRGLIDEYRILVNPVAFGDGKPVLGGLANDLALRLASTRTFASGNVLLTYEPRAAVGR